MSAPAREQRHADARALASRHRTALRARTRRIRGSVAALAVSLFLIVFAVVLVQLASGHDPALVAAARRRAASAGLSGSASKRAHASTSAGQRSKSGAAESSGASAGSESADATSSSSGSESAEASGSSGTSDSQGEESSSGAAAVTTSQS
ncbi:MAG TPA: hypothetical protein VMF09_10630 [Solirubrobacteraceae bacterium]|nr:hypothetical protein [Solirubrobacteraceae bacterium]